MKIFGIPALPRPGFDVRRATSTRCISSSSPSARSLRWPWRCRWSTSASAITGRTTGQIGARIEGSLPLELLWSVIPTIIAMVMFGWGASVFYHLRRPPGEAMHIYAVGKQWMWKFQHLEGQREINELHIPAGRPIKITISSEDVLHSLYFPAFRTKMDAIPGRYTELWFEANKPGTYHIFCTEYCGTNHAGMIGSVTVLEPAAYQAWLQGGGEGGSLAQRGARLFDEHGLQQLPSRQRPGPRSVAERHRRHAPSTLQDGSTVVVDEAYLRESILNSQAKIVRGLPAADADLPGPDQRREPRRPDRTRQVACRRRRRRRRRPHHAAVRRRCGGASRRRNKPC